MSPGVDDDRRDHLIDTPGVRPGPTRQTRIAAPGEDTRQ